MEDKGQTTDNTDCSLSVSKWRQGDLLTIGPERACVAEFPTSEVSAFRESCKIRITLLGEMLPTTKLWLKLHR